MSGATVSFRRSNRSVKVGAGSGGRCVASRRGHVVLVLLWQTGGKIPTASCIAHGGAWPVINLFPETVLRGMPAEAADGQRRPSRATPVQRWVNATILGPERILLCEAHKVPSPHLARKHEDTNRRRDFDSASPLDERPREENSVSIALGENIYRPPA